MEQSKYDIFISYRRTAYDTANLIAEKLRHAGYSVFFDIDTLTSGRFNEQLLQVINGCKDFILVLPESALDRCQDENDWIRREVTHAIVRQKNIIPVMLDGQSSFVVVAAGGMKPRTAVCHVDMPLTTPRKRVDWD